MGSTFSEFTRGGIFNLPADPITAKINETFGLVDKEEKLQAPIAARPLSRLRPLLPLEDPEKKRRGRRTTLLTAGQGAVSEGSAITPSSSRGRSPLLE